MNDQVLEKYQSELIKIREVYEPDCLVVSSKLVHMLDEDHKKDIEHKDVKLIEFYSRTKPLPPSHNIFARFNYMCTYHSPPHQGFYLLWNPNLDTNADKLESSLSNHCSSYYYQNVCKKIQSKLVEVLPEYFQLVDHYDYEFSLNYHNRVHRFRASLASMSDQSFIDSKIDTPSKSNENSNPEA